MKSAEKKVVMTFDNKGTPKWNGPFKYRLIPFDTACVGLCVAYAAIAYVLFDGKVAWWWMLALAFHIFIAGFNAQQARYWRNEVRDWKYLAEGAKAAMVEANQQFDDMFKMFREVEGVLSRHKEGEPDVRDVLDRLSKKMPKTQQ